MCYISLWLHFILDFLFDLTVLASLEPLFSGEEVKFSCGQSSSSSSSELALYHISMIMMMLQSCCCCCYMMMMMMIVYNYFYYQKVIHSVCLCVYTVRLHVMMSISPKHTTHLKSLSLPKQLNLQVLNLPNSKYLSSWLNKNSSEQNKLQLLSYSYLPFPTSTPNFTCPLRVCVTS